MEVATGNQNEVRYRLPWRRSCWFRFRLVVSSSLGRICLSVSLLLDVPLFPASISPSLSVWTTGRCSGGSESWLLLGAAHRFVGEAQKMICYLHPGEFGGGRQRKMQLRLSMAHIILLCSNVHQHFRCVGSDLRLDDINIDWVIFIKQLGTL